MQKQGRELARNSDFFGGAETLEAAIGKPRNQWSTDDLVELVEGAGIRIASLMHVGGDGWLKSLDFAPRGADHLRRILEGGERADGSSLFPGSGIQVGASDILLRPRPSRAFLDPFAEIPTLVLLCGHADPSGRPLPQSPDTVVRRAWDRFRRETGHELHALGEVEFFLGKHRDTEDIYGADDRGYHAASPFVFGEALRREALTLLSDLGFPVKYAHSEVGYIEPRGDSDLIWEQHEIELDLLPLPDAADAVVLTQWILRNLAHRQGFRCSTGPMMREGHAGNGLHFHLAPVRDGRCEPIRHSDGSFTDAARFLLAGLVTGGAALMAFGNRVPESFQRLSQGKEAPQRIAWGDLDRSALVRLPVVPTGSDGKAVPASTVEFRLPDGSAHPHLLLAGIAQSYLAARGREDLDELLENTSASGSSSQEDAPGIPMDSSEVGRALSAFSGALEEGGVFPPGFVERQCDLLMD